MVIQPFNFSRRLAGYSPASSNAASADRTAANPPTSLSSFCYSLAEVLSSRRFRLLLIPVAATFLVFATLSLGLPTPSIPAGWSSESQESGQAPVTAPDATAAFPGGVDWSRFAYNQYVTNSIYLCNSVMLFERLHHLGSRADRVMMYPSSMLDLAAPSGTSQSNDARLLLKARDEYGAILMPIKVQHRSGADSGFQFPSRA
jgi:hypothetical protein